jgi:hypothetical protein
MTLSSPGLDLPLNARKGECIGSAVTGKEAQVSSRNVAVATLVALVYLMLRTVPMLVH